MNNGLFTLSARLSIHWDFVILKGFVVKKSHISCMDKDVQ